MEAYLGDDVYNAEAALLKLRELVYEVRLDGSLPLKTENTLSPVNAYLYGSYDFLGHKNLATKYIDESVHYFVKSGIVDGGLSAAEKKRDSFAALQVDNATAEHIWDVDCTICPRDPFSVP